MFSCEFYGIFQNTFFYKTPLVAYFWKRINEFHATGLSILRTKHEKNSGLLIFSGNVERN